MAETWKKLAYYDEVATTFVGLTDTPANYTDAGSKLVRVNATPDGLEFVAASTVVAAEDPKAHKDLHDPEDGSDALDCAAASEIAGVQAAAEGSAHSFARSDHAHQIQHGITDNHLVTIDAADIAADEIGVFTANGLKSQTPAEVAATMALDDVGVPDAAVDFNDQQLTDAVTMNSAATPDPVLGKVYYDTDDDHLYCCTSVA